MLLEAANFEPLALLRTSERLALRTEGSNRWEKGVDPHLAGPAAALATRLLVELVGRALHRPADVQAELPRARGAGSPPGADEARARTRRACRSGQQGDPREGSASRDAKPGYRVPTWRARDVTREIDLVEEVARFVLDEIPFTLPAHDVTFGRLTPWQRIRRRVEDVLAGCGFSEAYTSRLVAEG